MRRLFIILGMLSMICTAARAVTISGKVIGPDGKAVAGAEVFIEQHFPGKRLLSLKTNKSGAFSADLEAIETIGYKPDVYGRAIIIKPGLAIGGGYLHRSNNVFRLGAAGQAWGSVADAQGRPVANARVCLNAIMQDGLYSGIWLPYELQARFAARTTADGRWAIHSVPTSGSVRVLLDDPRYVRVRCDAKLGANPVPAPTMAARPGATIAGKIIYQGGKPAGGVEIFAQGAGGPMSQLDGCFRTVSLADGSYKLTGLPSGICNPFGFRTSTGLPSGEKYTYNVIADEPTGKWIAAAIENVSVAEGRITRVPNLVLTRGAIVEGTVTDEDTAKPLPGVYIGSYGPHRPKSGANICTFTDEKGHYRLRVAPGNSYVWASGGPEGYSDVVTAGGEVKTVSFKLKRGQRGLSISGTVVDTDGNPVPDVPITIVMKCEETRCQPSPPSGNDKKDIAGKTVVVIVLPPSYSSKTDAQGNFTISGLTPGKAYTCIRAFFLDEHNPWEVAEPVEIEVPTSEPIKVVVRKLNLLTLTGRVVDTSGNPIPGAAVKFCLFMPAGNGLLGWATPRELGTDAEGRFSLDGIRPELNIQGLRAEKPGYKYVSGGQVTKEGDELKVADVVLQPDNKPG